MDQNLMEKIAIIFIGTGKYLKFLPKFYEHCESNFIKNIKKQYFVFTDGDLLNHPDNITRVYQEHLQWPFITLNRFETINRIKNQLEEFNWVVFMDADTLVVDTITADEFFGGKSLFGVHHPCSVLKMPPHNELPGSFETNPESRAFVDIQKINPSVYFQGCLWGGKTPEVFDLISELEKNTKEDLADNIIAVWHDESHLNRYFFDNIEKVHILSSGFAYPEIFSKYCKFKPRIIHLAKNNSKYHV